MAQKDIQDIAQYMKQLNESIAAEDEAYDEACREEEAFQAEEDEEFEDEVIDPASVGFIDDSDAQDESDDFYAEDDNDTFEEDVSDCVQQKVEEAEEQASITIPVYNEDGFGEHFCQEVMKNVPGTFAKVIGKPDANGDLNVKISGSRHDLEKAYAFYIGKTSFSQVAPEDVEEFESFLVFDDGDTLAEADYREAVAHCLDPIGVNASTANLVKQDTCKYSMVKEEIAKRKASKMLKALQEDDFSSLSDEDLEALSSIEDAIENQDEIDARHAKLWKQVLAQMGYTQEEWDKLSPEDQQKAFSRSAANNPVGSRTGFAQYQRKQDPNDPSKIIRYTNAYKVFDPKTGDADITAFNPNYSAEDSIYQHPSEVKRAERKRQESEFEKRQAEQLAAIVKDIRGKKDEHGKATWTKEEFFKILSTLTDKQRKDLYKSLLDDIEKNVSDPKQRGNEELFIREIFGKKPTLRAIAKAWDRTFPGVKLYADAIEAALYKAALAATGKAWGGGAIPLLAANPVMKQKFIDTFEEIMNARKNRGKDMAMDPEREARKAAAASKAKSIKQDA